MTEQKKNGRPTLPGSHSVSNQHRRRKPKSILHRLATKCKRMNWRMALAVILALLLVFVVVRFAFGDSEEPAAAGESRTAAEAMTPAPEPEATQSTAYIFRLGEGCPVNMEALTDAWAAEAGFEKRYTITDTERYELASAITAEATGEPFAGKVAVAQCMLVTHEPIKYFYAPELATSEWHESQVYVLTINKHKFFKEAQ